MANQDLLTEVSPCGSVLDQPAQADVGTQPGQALKAIVEHDGALVVDFDETLYLRNSTQDFIGSVRPALLAFILVKLVDFSGVWRLTGGASTRDQWRVGVLLVLMPWSLVVWRRKAIRLAEEATNHPLATAMGKSRQAKLVSTLGMEPVVAPLLDAMHLGEMRLLAMRPWNFAERRAGKRAMVERELGDEDLGRALVVTDSSDDSELLEACARPLLVTWPDARCRPAFSDSYIPGLYLSRIKRPGSKDLLTNFVGNDLVLWVLASLTFVTANPLLHLACLALLALSLWTIYEAGYADNDRVGARHETDAVLSEAYHDRHARMSFVGAWLWAAAAGAGAILILWKSGFPLATSLAAWTGVLLTTFLAFMAFNRLDKRSRVWVYGVLQVLRAAAFAAVVPVTPVGTLALASHALARWVPYYVYRFSSPDWGRPPVNVIRLMFFAVLVILLGPVISWSNVLSPAGIAIAAWFVLRGIKEWLPIIRNAGWISARP